MRSADPHTLRGLVSGPTFAGFSRPHWASEMRSTTLLLLLGWSSLAMAATDVSCDSVHQGLTDVQKKEWSSAINAQLSGRLESINLAFELSGWTIVFVDTKESDPPFLFFHGNPAKTRYVTMWSGAATRSEQTEMRNWVLKNAPGIPEPLANCFAWHATHGQDISGDFGG